MLAHSPTRIRSVAQRPLARPRVEVRRFAGTRALHRVLDAPLRVAHLTDQHVGWATPHAVQQLAIDQVNALTPDLVLLTGDYVGYGLDYLDALESLLGQLRAPAVGVLGNHDHWASATEVTAALRRAGVEVLSNQTATVTVGGQTLQIVGLDDGYTGHADVRRAVRGLDPRRPAVALSHLPEEADALWAAGVSLVLSGHTHSGQVSVGGVHRLMLGALKGHRYLHGLYGCRAGERAPGALYVSAGIGASRFDLRLGDRARREVAAFELGLLPGAFPEHHAEQRPSGRLRAAARERFGADARRARRAGRQAA